MSIIVKPLLFDLQQQKKIERKNFFFDLIPFASPFPLSFVSLYCASKCFQFF